MARRGENIYLRKDGRYEGRYIKGRKQNGKPQFGSIYGRRYEEVKLRLVVLKAQCYTEKSSVVLAAYGAGTLQEWAEYWLEMLVRPYVKAATYDCYWIKLKKHIIPALGARPLRTIAQEDINGFLKGLMPALAPSTANDVLRVLKALLREAKVRKLLQGEPWAGVKRIRQPHTHPRVLSLHEQKRMEKACCKTQQLDILTGLYTGLRVGELAGLQWKDVDFQAGLLHVRHAVHRVKQTAKSKEKTCLILGAPKSDSSVRDVPVPQFLLEFLWAHRAAAGANPGGQVFPGRGGALLDPRTLQARLQRMAQRLRLQGVHCHTLRHTYATRCLEKKIGLEVLADVLGHSSTKITCEVYAHCTPQHKQKELRKLQLLSA